MNMYIYDNILLNSS